MKYYVFVYDPCEQAYFCAGEFDRYGDAAKEAARRCRDRARKLGTFGIYDVIIEWYDERDDVIHD